MRGLVVTMLALSLSGCWQSRGETTGRTKAVERYEEHPTPDGGKLATRTTTTESVSDTSSQTGVDPQAITDAVSAAVRGVAGGSGWGEIGTLIGGAGTAAAGAYALAKRAQASYHRKDADAAWDKLLDKHEANKDS
jgi:hypothetical protein